MKKSIYLYGLIACFMCFKNNTDGQTFKVVIPLGGNAWVNAPANITDSGLTGWTSRHSVASIYFRLSIPQELNLALRMRVLRGKSTIRITVNKKAIIKQVVNTGFDTIAIGRVKIDQPGYVKVGMEGLDKTGPVYAEVPDLIVTGQKADNAPEYVKTGSSFHFGRRGPSVHLHYHVPAGADKEIRWFYNEITVPAGMDVIGSYYMADGFGEGYFGMQVNSATERRVLFSVWSPFVTEDPANIPDSMKIKLLAKGSDVHAGEFGNEGSGGQSYKQFPWQAGKTYAFLIGAEPDSTTHTTTYTAYFKDVAAGKWYLIASFLRPKTLTYLNSLYSFLENFEPDGGDKTRMALYGNQWVADHKGNWTEVTGVTYTGDATAKGKYRKDYAGGVNGKQFYLKNCGFFNGFVELNSAFKREPLAVKPTIDLKSLPKE